MYTWWGFDGIFLFTINRGHHAIKTRYFVLQGSDGFDPKDFSYLVFFFLSTLFLRVGLDYGQKVHWSVKNFSLKQS